MSDKNKKQTKKLYRKKIISLIKQKKLPVFPNSPTKFLLFPLNIIIFTKENSLFHTVGYKNHSVGYIFHTVKYKSRTVKQRMLQCI